MSSRKYMPEVTWGEVQDYIETHTAATGHTAVVRIHTHGGPSVKPHLSVSLFPLGDAGLGQGVVTVRAEYPSKAPARQMRAVLHAVAQAYQELDLNPWLWTPERRRAARGEV